MTGKARVRQDGWHFLPKGVAYTWIDVEKNLYDLEGNHLSGRLPEQVWVTAHVFDAHNTGLYVLEDDDTVFTCPSNYLEYEGEK